MIQGLQKLTLLDYPGKVACTVFTAGCNFRCPFCHNASLVLEPSKYPGIGTKKVLEFLEKRQGVLDGVCITGGEPLLQKDIRTFMEQVKRLGYLIKLDTNGSFPERMIELTEAGLVDYVAMDVKNSEEKYAMTIGMESFELEPVRKSIQYLKTGVIPYEFRTTVVREFHQKQDFISLGEWLAGAEKYFLQGFVDSGELIRPGLHGYSEEIMEEAMRIVKKNVPSVELRGIK